MPANGPQACLKSCQSTCLSTLLMLDQTCVDHLLWLCILFPSSSVYLLCFPLTGLLSSAQVHIATMASSLLRCILYKWFLTGNRRATWQHVTEVTSILAHWHLCERERGGGGLRPVLKGMFGGVCSGVIFQGVLLQVHGGLLNISIPRDNMCMQGTPLIALCAAQAYKSRITHAVRQPHVPSPPAAQHSTAQQPAPHRRPSCTRHSVLLLSLS